MVLILILIMILVITLSSLRINAIYLKWIVRILLLYAGVSVLLVLLVGSGVGGGSNLFPATAYPGLMTFSVSFTDN
jgi:hypothetical protein